MVLPIPRNLVVIPVLVLLLADKAWATSPAVSDAAGFFSPEAKLQATEEIEEVQRQFNQTVLIETVNAPSTLKKWSLQFKSPESRTRFYRDWAIKEARKIGPNSIVVLICKEPGPIQIAVAAGRDAEKRAFPAGDCEVLKDKIKQKFDQNQFDEGLTEGILFIRQLLTANKGDQPLAGPSNRWSGVFSSCLVLVGLWLCLEMAFRLQVRKTADAESTLQVTYWESAGSYPSSLFAAMNRK